jgi:hypothetical protein
MIWGGKTRDQERIEALEAQVQALTRERDQRASEADEWHTQCRLLRHMLGEQFATARAAATVDGEFLALTREASGLRTTVSFLNGHIDAISRERQELLGVLLKTPIEAPRYEIDMAPPTAAQEAIHDLGRTATGVNVGDVLNKLRDARDGIGVRRAADDLGVFDDQGDLPLPE